MNLPNKLTLFRIVLIPFFIFFMATYFVKYSPVWALIIFLIASFTDFLDGYIARKNNLITDFGKLMDPLADKMLVVSALIMFTSQGLINSVFVIIIISRDFIINSIRLLAASEGKVIAADIWGKVKTVFQMIAIIVLLLYKSLIGVISEKKLIYVKTAGDILIYIAVILTIVSCVNYALKNIKIKNK